ncbi:Fur family transcriptional regulator [Arenibacter latericius]|uniref:Fur family transcriptional regulator n=1 Tax=Arenibacter latericius TaxID=86104 RepID=UPI000479843E|nr:transcriptional repressor [Arenibacter latericius]
MSDLEQILENNNVKPTAMRLLVLQYLLNKKVTVSLVNIEAHFHNSDRTTLYRTLKTFVENGVAHQIDDGTGSTKYAICEENCNCDVDTDLHLHFHCANCNETVCLTAHKIPHINLPEGFKAENVNLVVKGICDKCNGQ